MSDELRSDSGPFSIVPEWVTDSPISDGAHRLYAVLARYADSGDGSAFPARSTLAKRLHCSTDTVDRRVAELVKITALIVRPRFTEGGDQTSNLYIIRRARPPAEVLDPGRTDAAPPAADTRPPSRTDAATPSRTDAAQNLNHSELKPLTDTARAQSLAAEWWDAFKSAHDGTEPMQGFLAIRGIVKKALTAKHSDEHVRRALARIKTAPLTAFMLQRELDNVGKQQYQVDYDALSRTPGIG